MGRTAKAVEMYREDCTAIKKFTGIAFLVLPFWIGRKSSHFVGKNRSPIDRMDRKISNIKKKVDFGRKSSALRSLCHEKKSRIDPTIIFSEISTPYDGFCDIFNIFPADRKNRFSQTKNRLKSSY